MPHIYIEPEEIIAEFEDSDLIEEIEKRGYSILQENGAYKKAAGRMKGCGFWLYPKTPAGEYPVGSEHVRYLLRLGLKEDAQNEALALACEITQEASSFFHA